MRDETANPLLTAAFDAIDAQIEVDADLQLILDQTAGILGCRLGVCGPDDERTAGGPSRGSAAAARRTTHAVPGVGEVWLENAAGLSERDARRVAQRLGIAAKFDRLRRRSAGELPLMSVVDESLSTEIRGSVLRRLGTEPSSLVTVFALVACHEDAEVFVAQLRTRATNVLHVEDRQFHLVMATDLTDYGAIGVPVGSRAAHSGPAHAINAPTAWRQAKIGLRFCRPSRHPCGPYALEEATLVDADQLGGYALFAEVATPQQIREVEDVRRLNRFVDETDDDVLICLEAVAATDSIRKAARHLHLHHNSVTDRIRRAERYLGYRFTAPYGRTRLFLTLVMRRLLESADLVEASSQLATNPSHLNSDPHHGLSESGGSHGA